MSTKRQGAIAVAEAVSYYTKLGYSVFVPVSDVSKFDLVIEKDGVLLRVEVKSCSRDNGEFTLVTKGGNTSWSGEVKRVTSDNCDKVFLYNLKTDNRTELDSKDLEGRSSIVFK